MGSQAIEYVKNVPHEMFFEEDEVIKDVSLEMNMDEQSDDISLQKKKIYEEKKAEINVDMNEIDEEEIDEIPHEVSDDYDDEASVVGRENINNHGQQSKSRTSHHVCYICKKSFSSLGTLKQHIRNHIGDNFRDEENGMSDEMANLMVQVTKDQDSAMWYLFDVGCLHSTPPFGCNVEGCVSPMKFHRFKGKYVWMCCEHKRKTKSIRRGSILDNSKMPMDRMLKIAFIWACEIDTNTAAKSIVQNTITILHWKDFFRSICSQHFLRNPIRIGGRGEVVQIDTIVYKTRKRTEKGGMNIKNYFVGYCPATPEGFIFFVPDFEEKTLFPIIEKHILPGSVIHSDLMPVFKSIPEFNVEPAFSHVTVESTDDFVCPVTGEHVNYAELFYRKHEERYVEIRGIPVEKCQSYLDELMWRDRYGQSQKSALENLFLHIKQLYHH